MKLITRTPTSPACFNTQPASQVWGAFIGTPCHNEVGLSLRKEQCGLCCYCELKLQNDESHIDHMEPRSVNSARWYDYSNCVMSCNGGVSEHCGRYKDNPRKNHGHVWNGLLFSVPHDPGTATLLQYLTDGSVVSASPPDQLRAEYMIAYLGLNCPRLSYRRRAHAREIIDTLGAGKDPKVVSWVRDYYLNPDSAGSLRQFYSLSRTLLVS
jgi:uncharacterized protein (TIGR02646 family)